MEQMTKIILNTDLKTSTEFERKTKIKGILNKRHILFKEDDYVVNIGFFKNTITMTREKENKKIKIIVSDNEKSKIEYTINNLKLEIPIIIKKCLKTENKIIINYQIVDSKEEIYYEINYKKRED